MPRKGPAPRRELMPDPIYRSVVVTQLVNKVLLRGQRSTSEHIVYKALDEISRKTGGDPVAVLKRAVENVRPQLEVKSRRVGGATYQVPGRGPAPPGHDASRSAGSSATPASAGRRRWPSACRPSSWTPATASAPRSSAVRTSRRWRNQTRLSRITAGKSALGSDQ